MFRTHALITKQLTMLFLCHCKAVRKSYKFEQLFSLRTLALRIRNLLREFKCPSTIAHLIIMAHYNNECFLFMATVNVVTVGKKKIMYSRNEIGISVACFNILYVWIYIQTQVT